MNIYIVKSGSQKEGRLGGLVGREHSIRVRKVSGSNLLLPWLALIM